MIIFLSRYKIRRTTFIIDFLISLLKKVYVIEMGPIFDCSQSKYKWISPASLWNSCTVITLTLGHLPQNFIMGHREVGKVLTLPISNMNQTPVFILRRVIGSILYAQLCPIPSPLVLIFTKKRFIVQFTKENEQNDQIHT